MGRGRSGAERSGAGRWLCLGWCGGGDGDGDGDVLIAVRERREWRLVGESRRVDGGGYRMLG
jgi:hypothetical protein